MKVDCWIYSRPPLDEVVTFIFKHYLQNSDKFLQCFAIISFVRSTLNSDQRKPSKKKSVNRAKKKIVIPPPPPAGLIQMVVVNACIGSETPSWAMSSKLAYLKKYPFGIANLFRIQMVLSFNTVMKRHWKRATTWVCPVRADHTTPSLVGKSIDNLQFRKLLFWQNFNQV